MNELTLPKLAALIMVLIVYSLAIPVMGKSIKVAESTAFETVGMDIRSTELQLQHYTIVFMPHSNTIVLERTANIEDDSEQIGHANGFTTQMQEFIFFTLSHNDNSLTVTFMQIASPSLLDIENQEDRYALISRIPLGNLPIYKLSAKFFLPNAMLLGTPDGQPQHYKDDNSKETSTTCAEGIRKFGTTLKFYSMKFNSSAEIKQRRNNCQDISESILTNLLLDNTAFTSVVQLKSQHDHYWKPQRTVASGEAPLAPEVVLPFLRLPISNNPDNYYQLITGAWISEYQQPTSFKTIFSELIFSMNRNRLSLPINICVVICTVGILYSTVGILYSTVGILSSMAAIISLKRNLQSVKDRQLAI